MTQDYLDPFFSRSRIPDFYAATDLFFGASLKG